MANMTGPEHYRVAEEMATRAEGLADQFETRGDEADGLLAGILARLAETHASLARTSLEALAHDDHLTVPESDAWRAAVTTGRPVTPREYAAQRPQDPTNPERK